MEEWTERFAFDCNRGKNSMEKRKAKRFENMQKVWQILMELEHLEISWEKRLQDVQKRLYRKGKESYDACYESFCKAREQEDFGSREWDRMMEKIVIFFIYTYFCGAVYDDAVYSKVLLSAFSAAWIEECLMAEYKEKVGCQKRKRSFVWLISMPGRSNTPIKI